MSPSLRRRLGGTLAIAAFTAGSITAYAQTTPVRSPLNATRTAAPPVIDGSLTDGQLTKK